MRVPSNCIVAQGRVSRVYRLWHGLGPSTENTLFGFDGGYAVVATTRSPGVAAVQGRWCAGKDTSSSNELKEKSLRRMANESLK